MHRPARQRHEPSDPVSVPEEGTAIDIIEQRLERLLTRIERLEGAWRQLQAREIRYDRILPTHEDLTALENRVRQLEAHTALARK